MHLVDGEDILLDPEGLTMAADAVPASALAQARDCIAGDVRDGRINLAYRIDVHDGGGEVVYSLSFADAVEIIGER